MTTPMIDPLNPQQRSERMSRVRSKVQRQNAVRETPSYKLFLSSGKKHIYEKDFKVLRDSIIAEAWGKNDQNSFYGAMAWFNPKDQAVCIVLQEDGIAVHMNADYEEWFKKWYKRQGPTPKTFPSNLNWYSQKREEFDRIYREEKQRWDSTDYSK